MKTTYLNLFLALSLLVPAAMADDKKMDKMDAKKKGKKSKDKMDKMKKN